MLIESKMLQWNKKGIFVLTFQERSSKSKLNLRIERYHLHGVGVRFQRAINTSGEFEPGLPDTLVIHFTAGSNLASSVDVLTSPENKVSAHFAVGRNGDIVQMMPTNLIAWHAGRSNYMGRSGYNRYSIGIELDNAGQLEKRDDGLFKSWFGKSYSANEVVTAVHRNQQTPTHWHKYTDEQLLRTFDLCKVLIEHHAITTIVGHDEIAPKRKVDPGPAFPLDEFRAALLGGATTNL